MSSYKIIHTTERKSLHDMYWFEHYEYNIILSRLSDKEKEIISKIKMINTNPPNFNDIIKNKILLRPDVLDLVEHNKLTDIIYNPLSLIEEGIFQFENYNHLRDFYIMCKSKLENWILQQASVLNNIHKIECFQDNEVITI